MKRATIIFLVIASFSARAQITKLYVKFGYAKTVLEKKNDGVIRIYFDRWGNIYPDMYINDTLIEECYSNLSIVYNNNQSLFNIVKKKHQLPANATKDQLQEKLTEEASATINSMGRDKQVVFMIHGFNKHPLKPDSSSAYEEFKYLREAILKKYSLKKFQFVEIYWDGCTWVNGAEWKKELNSMKVWDNAEAASNAVAVELRRILYRINYDHAVIISHSLGASIVTCALFNVDKFNLYVSPDNYFKRYIKKCYGDSIHYNTPMRNFRVGLLAPAIPGKNTFDDYYKRIPPSQENNDNFYFVIGYNVNDPVLKKYIGLSKQFGSTSLGSLKTEVEVAERMRNTKERTIVEDVDFSLRADSSKQNIHDFKEYVKNEKYLNEFLEKLLGQ